jgi:hypothetical protein
VLINKASWERVKTLIRFLLHRIVFSFYLGFPAFPLFHMADADGSCLNLALQWRREVGAALVEARIKQLRPSQDHHRLLQSSVVLAAHLVARTNPR